MEEPWVQRFRSMAKIQSKSLVHALIDERHHLILKRRDGHDVDAGPIKVKPPGTLAYVAYTVEELEPDIYVTTDGKLWHGAASQGKFAGGASYPDAGCWTGDRFLVGVYMYADFVSCVLQSRDGGTWAFHPDNETFGKNVAGSIYAMDASGTGLVVATGASYLTVTPFTNSSFLAISRDFGETWNVIPVDSLDFPSTLDPGEYLYTCVKSDLEFLVNDGTHIVYTFDGGHHWTPVEIPSEFNIYTGNAGAMRYFNGYWWLFGYGSGTGEWDTPLIRSKDLLIWEPVITPWSGTYPPFEVLHGSPHSSNSGTLVVMDFDVATNTAIAVGSPPGYGGPTSAILISTNGGETWQEVGFKFDAHFKDDYGWDGYFILQDDLNFDAIGAMACGYGWWFLANGWGTADEHTPPIVRVSIDGRIAESVYPAQEVTMYGYVMLSGGDVNF